MKCLIYITLQKKRNILDFFFPTCHLNTLLNKTFRPEGKITRIHIWFGETRAGFKLRFKIKIIIFKKRGARHKRELENRRFRSVYKQLLFCQILNIVKSNRVFLYLLKLNTFYAK